MSAHRDGPPERRRARRSRPGRLAAIAAVGAAGLLAAAGCGAPQPTVGTSGSFAGPSGTSSGPTVTSSASVQTTAPPAGPSTPASSPASSPPALAECSTADLSVTAGRSLGALGHIGVVLLLRNVGHSACVTEGYPGVAGLNAAGRQVVQARRTPAGYLGGLSASGVPALLRLPPGASASALVEGTDVPTGNATSCPTYPALLVTPPNDTHSVVVRVRLPGCSGLQIHPVVPGTGGGLH